MYIFSPDELRLIHEERVAQLTNDYASPKRKVNRKPRKWNLKWFKRNQS